MRIHALDLFCGAGGSSQGAVQAGATLVGAIDAWELATRTLKDNHPDVHAIAERLHAESRPDPFLRRKKVDLLLASPECTNHSVAKGNAPRCEESRQSANYIFNFIEDLKPTWIVIENVVEMRKWFGYRPLIGKLHELEYGVCPQVINSADFGVPQTRSRLFLLCERHAEPTPVPLPTGMVHKPARSFVDLTDRWPSRPLYRDKRAAATIARAERAIAELGVGVPFLIVYYGTDGAGGWQPLDRPIRTLTTLDRFGLVTWKGAEPYLRMLHVEELRAAMGFPSSYRFTHGSRRDQVKMLGNGVCPPVMEAVVRHLTGSRRRVAGPRTHGNLRGQLVLA
ncbi:DNA cytosine methyltransferase [Azohydromonas australica]|uniref:DNA cytosine methyltransferase n=1 Tax=Azohydromonas australica TaxID=364039 RepID=UPI000686D1D1|nr:DNA cytosine methyltransferase [Azohydromonas australica]